MQKKLSKHFIYRWLEEDLYGEYSLHHFNSKFSNQLLLNLWSFLTDTRRSQRGSLVFGLKTTRYLDFISSALRYGFLTRAVINLNLVNKSVSLKSQLDLSRIKKNFYATLLSTNKFLLSAGIKPKLHAPMSFKNKFSEHKKEQPEIKFFFNTIKYGWRKSRRVRRTRAAGLVLKRKTFLIDVPSKLVSSVTNEVALAEITSKQSVEAEKKKNFLIFYKKSFIKRAANCSTLRRRSTNNFHYFSLPLWRFCTNLKFSYVNNAVRSQIRLNTVSGNLKNYVLSFSWDNFSYKLKQKIRKFLQSSKITRKPFLNLANPKLKFKGTFQKRVVPVKKNEVTRILNFRMLNYFNLVTTPSDLEAIYYEKYYKAKVMQLPSPTIFEFHIVPSLLRSGFFENGYITNSLVKRKLFLLNGMAVKDNVTLTVWDIVALSKPVWWLVYARFINFFTGVANSSSIVNLQGILKTAGFVQQFVKLKTLFKKVDFRTKSSNTPNVAKIIYLKNYVFALPPSYMEVSYKMFMFIIYRLANKFTDVTVPFNRRGFKTILSSSSSRLLN